jgi:hypothetical protein
VDFTRGLKLKKLFRKNLIQLASEWNAFEKKEKKGWRKSKYVLIELTSFHVNGLKRESKELVVEEKYGYEMKKNQADMSISIFFY